MRKNLLRKQILALSLFSISLFSSTLISAQIVVTESDVTRQAENTPPTDNWVLYTRAGTPATAGVFINGPANPPLGCGSLQLTTATGSEKVFLFNYDHIGTPLSEIDDISYWTYRTAGNDQQVTALNLQVDYNGDAAGGFTTLVFEPVYNTDQGAVVNDQWQDWDAINGGNAIWWSTRDIPGVCAFTCYVSWSDIVAANPDAVIIGGVGVNQGSGNPGLVTAVDAFTFDETTYDFEPDTDGDGITDCTDCAPNDNKNDKVLVCHKGETICVSKNAVQAHLDHGDAVGPCPTTPTQSNYSDVTMSLKPSDFQISNYPNPFNNKTRIQYSIPVASKVNITVYDAMGRTVSTLVDADKGAGIYSVDFDGTKVSKGIYYYRLTATSNGTQNVQTRNMTVIK